MVACLLLLAPAATVIVELDALAEGVKVGHSRITTVTYSDGASKTEIDGTFTLRGITVRGIGRYQYRKDGRPTLYEFQRASGPDPAQMTRKTIGETVAVIEELSHGKVQTSRKIQIPRGAKLVDPTWVWARRGFPKKGTKATYSSLSGEGEWELETVTYLGQVPLTVAGEQVLAHLTQSSSKNWTDASGIPYRIETNMGGVAVTLERISIKKS